MWKYFIMHCDTNSYLPLKHCVGQTDRGVCNGKIYFSRLVPSIRTVAILLSGEIVLANIEYVS